MRKGEREVGKLLLIGHPLARDAGPLGSGVCALLSAANSGNDVTIYAGEARALLAALRANPEESDER